MFDLLDQTTASLVQFQRQWGDLLSSGAVDARPGRLVEVTDFGAGPGDLRMFTHVPDGLRPGAPLVVALHGCNQTAADYDHATGWSALAGPLGFAVLLPEQKRAKNPNSCFTWFEPADNRRDQGEPLSIRLMIEWMLVTHGLDRRRVYVTGLSSGGAMTSVMLATYPELFVGGAILAGLPYGCATGLQEALDSMSRGRTRTAEEWGSLVRAASPQQGPWPRVSIWHGAADTTVAAMNAGEIVKQWTDLHGLGPLPAIEDVVDGHPHRVWRNAAGEALVEAYTIPGMAHGVPVHPGGERHSGAVGPFAHDVGISSTFHIAEFWGLAEPVPPTKRRLPRIPAAATARAGRRGRPARS